MKMEFGQQISGKASNIKFCENSSGGSRVVAYQQTYRLTRHDAANNRFSQLCERPSKRSGHLTVRRDIIALFYFRLLYCGIWWSYHQVSYGFPRDHCRYCRKLCNHGNVAMTITLIHSHTISCALEGPRVGGGRDYRKSRDLECGSVPSNLSLWLCINPGSRKCGENA